MRRDSKGFMGVALLVGLILALVQMSIVGAIGNIQDLTALGGTTTGTNAIAQALVGDGVEITSATFTGNAVQVGTFASADAQIGFSNGIVLSSGNIAGIDDSGSGLSSDVGSAGDADLTALSQQLGGGVSYNAAVLTVSFVPTADRVFFRYVFASVEAAGVGQIFNDVFGAFVNGQNCALVGESPVSVATINAGSNADLYRPNTNGEIPGIGFTMLTKILTCEAPVVANQTNTLKLALADITDPVVDSAVFIKAASFTTTAKVVVDDVQGDEGTAIPLSATVNDPDSDSLTYLWTIDSTTPPGLTCTLSGETTLTAALTCPDNGSATVSLAVDDGISAVASVSGVVAVSNVAPVITSLTGVPVNGGLQITGSVADVADDVSSGITWQMSVNGGPVTTVSLPVFVPVNLDDTGGTATFVAVDKDGGESAPQSIQLTSAMDLLLALEEDVNSNVSNAGFRMRLMNRLEIVRLMLTLRLNGAAALHLEFFEAQVNQYSRVGITRAVATDLKNQSNTIQDMLGY